MQWWKQNKNIDNLLPGNLKLPGSQTTSLKILGNSPVDIRCFNLHKGRCHSGPPEIDVLLVPTDKASTLPTDHLITG